MSRVLVVDDLDLNLKIIESKLALEYYEVVSAKSGKEAIKILSEQEFDIILLDITMPEMNGIETCRKIKESGKEIWKIFLFIVNFYVLISCRRIFIFKATRIRRLFEIKFC